MSQIAREHGPAVTVKPQADIYTLLLIVAIIALGVAVGMVLYNLLTPVAEGGYGLDFGAIFDPSKLPATPKGIRPPK